MRFLQTDGGKQFSSRPQQTNDCTVVAVAMICDLSYDAAYEALRAVGRKSNRGFRFPSGGWKHGDIGAWHFHYFKSPEGETVRSFVTRNPKGRWVLGLHHHVLAVKDGTVFDHTPPAAGERLWEIWSVSRIPA